MSKILFSVLSIVFSILPAVFYIVSICKKKTKPHAVTWFVWAVIALVIGYLQYVNGGGLGSLTLFTTSLLSFIIFGFALEYHREHVNRMDIWCLFLALFGVALFAFVDSKSWSLLILIITDFLGFIPTIRKTWRFPYTESLAAYQLFSLKFVFGTLALTSFEFQNWVYGAYAVICNLMFTAMVLWRRSVRRHKK